MQYNQQVGPSIEQNPYRMASTIAPPPPPKRKPNYWGVWGFSLSLASIFLGLVSMALIVISYGLLSILILLPPLVYCLGLIFSAIGCCRKPRGLAVAGVIISIIHILLILGSIVAIFWAIAAGIGWLVDLLTNNPSLMWLFM